jgi:predicted DNA-binding mobile mystery protein A
MGISQAGASAIENREIGDSLTLKTLKEAATALNCRLIYFLIPEENLEESVTRQAIKFVKNSTGNLSHSMKLENQGVSPKDSDDFIKIQAQEALRRYANKIWDVE